MHDIQDPEAVFRAVIADFGRGDVDGVVARFSDEATVTDFSDPDTVYQGREQIAALVAGFIDMFDDLSTELSVVVAQADRVAAELLVRGTPRGAHERVEVRYGVFQTVRDGHITSEHLYIDPAQLPSRQ